MTRAKYRLYLPVFIDETDKREKQGAASCMDLFLARLDNGGSLVSFIDRMREENVSISYNELQEIPLLTEQVQPLHEPVSLLPALSCDLIPGAPTLIYSFTSLMRGEAEEQASTIAPPHDLQALEKNLHTLPAGAETGNLLHQIFEKISFEPFREMQHHEECLPLILPYLQQHPLEEWSSVIAEIVFKTLKMPLGRESFALCDLVADQLYREMEFLYPWEGDPIQFPEEIRLENQFLKGFIDLFFIYEGKYYLVDWKSNWLGASADDYHEENLKRAMDGSGYHFQAKIYQEALKRYLKLVDGRPFDECFGGTYYLFLRGSAQGIYQVR